MAQQPNVEIAVEEKPSAVPEPGAARSWEPRRPGDDIGPDQPWGGHFGRTGPNTGYALRLIAQADFPRDHRADEVEAVVGTIAGARASHYGRAPVMGDVRVGLALLGFGVDGDPGALAARRDHILDHTAHEHTKGQAFVASVPDDVLFGDEAGARAHVAADL